jgi:hypothetical protein
MIQLHVFPNQYVIEKVLKPLMFYEASMWCGNIYMGIIYIFPKMTLVQNLDVTLKRKLCIKKILNYSLKK